MSEAVKMRVVSMRYEADGVLSIELAQPDGALLPPVEAGAHIDLHLGNGLVRSYSLVLPRCTPRSYAVAVLRDRGSRGGSAFVHQQLRVGDEILVGGPRNHFRLVEDAAQTVLIGGGIGITPIFSMFARMVELGRPVSLLYGVRSRAQAAFLRDIEALRHSFTWHIDDAVGGPPDLGAYLDGFDRSAHVYCCGPTPMLDGFERICEALGFTNVHLERFAPPVQAPVAAQDQAFELLLARSQRSVQVQAGESLYDVLQSCGAKVDFSCREGICGACETRVLEGTVAHRDSVLSKAERAAGKTMMVCVSTCAGGGRLVLDL